MLGTVNIYLDIEGVLLANDLNPAKHAVNRGCVIVLIMNKKSFLLTLPIVLIGLIALVLNQAFIGIVLIASGVGLGAVLNKKGKK